MTDAAWSLIAKLFEGVAFADDTFEGGTARLIIHANWEGLSFFALTPDELAVLREMFNRHPGGMQPEFKFERDAFQTRRRASAMSGE